MYKPNELGIYDMTGNAAEYTYGISPDVTIGKAFATVQGGHYNGRRGGAKPENFVIYKDDTSWGEGPDVGLRLVFQKKK